jgi:hypothetical protein
MGAGSPSESNVIHIPVAKIAPEVLLNNGTYPLTSMTFSDTETIVKLDKYETVPTGVSDDQVIGASYNKIDVVTRGHVVALTSYKFAKSLHALAPSTNTANTPVLNATGAVVGNRKRLIYDDLVALKEKLDKMECPVEGRRVVLCAEHYNDLLLDRERFGNLLVNYTAGMVAPIIAGFEVFQYIKNPIYNSLTLAKRPFASIPQVGDLPASVAFYKENVAKKTGLTKQYFKNAIMDPENPVNKLNYRHYFLVTNIELKYIGAII